jgi:hypothetical protein
MENKDLLLAKRNDLGNRPTLQVFRLSTLEPLTKERTLRDGAAPVFSCESRNYQLSDYNYQLITERLLLGTMEYFKMQTRPIVLDLVTGQHRVLPCSVDSTLWKSGDITRWGGQAKFVMLDNAVTMFNGRDCIGWTHDGTTLDSFKQAFAYDVPNKRRGFESPIVPLSAGQICVGSDGQLLLIHVTTGAVTTVAMPVPTRPVYTQDPGYLDLALVGNCVHVKRRFHSQDVRDMVFAKYAEPLGDLLATEFPPLSALINDVETRRRHLDDLYPSLVWAPFNMTKLTADIQSYAAHPPLTVDETAAPGEYKTPPCTTWMVKNRVGAAVGGVRLWHGGPGFTHYQVRTLPLCHPTYASCHHQLLDAQGDNYASLSPSDLPDPPDHKHLIKIVVNESVFTGPNTNALTCDGLGH